MSVKAWPIFGALICCLLLTLATNVAFADHTNTSPYFKIYQQDSPDWWDRTHNIMWCNVMPDGTCYAGGNTCSPQQWRDEQVNGSAVINWNTNSARFGEVAKSVVPFNGHLYCGGANGAFIEQDAWVTGMVPPTGNPPYNWTSSTGFHVLTNAATGYYIGGANGIKDGSANSKLGNIQSVVTDGNFIYSNDNISASANLIHKWIINETTWTCTDAPGWPVAIGDSTSCKFPRGMSIYKGSDGNNKLCVINTVNKDIYEIDCATGAYSIVISGSTWTAPYTVYSVARYGNDIFVPEYTGNVSAAPFNWVLRNFHFDGSTWVGNDYDLGIENPYWNKTPTSGGKTTQIGYFGVGLKGDGVNAKYMWVTSAGGQMSFWDLSPYGSTTTLEDPNSWKNGYPVLVGGAVVTALGAEGDGFWVENTTRTKGAFIKWSGTLPPRDRVVTIKGSASLTSGVRSINATEVTVGDQATIKPLFVTNKAMAPATGSAGLANDGMLVKISGKLTYSDVYGSTMAFYIDDGSGVPSDITGVTGVKVRRTDGYAPGSAPNFDLIANNQPCYVTVTGIVKPEKVGSNIIRTIAVRDDQEVVITALP